MGITTFSGAPPSQMFAGDTLVWTLSAPAWTGATLAFSIRARDGSVVSANGVEVAGVFTFTISNTASAALKTGSAAWAVRATLSGQSETILSGAISVVPQFGASEAESHVSRTVALLEAHIEGRVVDGIDEFTINGQAIKKIPIVEAIRMLRVYKAELQRIRDEIASAAGISRGRYLTRFVGN